MIVTYHRDSVGGYHGITTDSPDGFKGLVFAGRGPKHRGGPETIHDQSYKANQFHRWTKVETEDVPDRWLKAIGYEQPAPAQVPAPVPVPVQVQVPVRHHGPLMQDPMFWPLAIAIFVIIFILLQGCI